ncbi:Transmembrane protein C9orf5 [Zostera marina]|uniref:Transmembrane protein C9orf5 n=1 Tax=Zostera marina TaxID=29655 RepID=A0A0K9PP20_ZOSMR|nr:Transmembrane protein C9orf5 [Zostera marina]
MGEGGEEVSSSSESTNPPWSEMFRSASGRRAFTPIISKSQLPEQETSSSAAGMDPEQRLALNIAMAHAALAFSIFLLYGIYRLLQDFLRPILWAVLCSIPLREVHRTVVSFWSPPLERGFIDTCLAVPVAVFRVSSATILDIRRAFLFKKSAGTGTGEVGFEKLVQWLVSFGWFVFSYEILGLGVIAVYGLLFLFASRTAASYARSSSAFVGSRLDWFKLPTRGILQSLETLVAVGLIFALISGVLFGGALFSYKIAVESKDAVMSFKTHVQGSNYADRIGFKKWINENDIPGMVDQYSSKLYDSVWEQIDTMAAQHNMSDFASGFKQFITNGNRSELSLHRMSSTFSSDPSSDQTFAKKLQVLSSCFSRGDWSGISGEMYSILNELITTRQDLVEKAKDYAFHGVELLSGAAEVLHLVSQSMVFFWLLYYLITSESGGATTQVMNMVPISDEFKGRCVEVINHAISSVLMATAKMAFFQGCLTLLVFRFFNVHFLYGSTFLAFLSPLLPLLPTWISSVPMVIELFIEGRLILAAVLFVAHNAMIQYGAFAIQSDVSGHSAYLTSLSILGGMTLFTSALEGAIMGPLILTLVMALKNLYVEFVLGNG